MAETTTTDEAAFARWHRALDNPSQEPLGPIRDHVAQALARAWDEGAAKASPHGGAYLRSFYAENPYRAPAGGRDE